MENLGFRADRRAVLIAGPTASGKSALALRLAERWNGVIINADSMQVYAELSVLTARPSEAEMARAPHRLYGEVPASTRFSVARWREAAARELDAAWVLGKLPIVAGGTGLYFSALTEGLAAVPPVPAEIRAGIADRAARLGIAALHAELARHDPPGAARLEPNDRTRVLRALEVIEATGKPLAHWQETISEPPLLDFRSVSAFVIDPDRALLYERIGRRFDAMVGMGALEEVEALLALGLDPALPAMKAIGVREFSEHLAGRLALDDAIERAKMETRRYAKRQMTWFRHRMADWRSIASADEGTIEQMSIAATL